MGYKKYILSLCATIGLNIFAFAPPKKITQTEIVNTFIQKNYPKLALNLKKENITIPLVTQTKVGQSVKKINLILIYQNNNPLYTSENSDVYQALQDLGKQLTKRIPFQNNEQAGIVEIISIQYNTINNETVQAIKNIFQILIDSNKGPNNVKNITYAFGESTHLINMASHNEKPLIDTMIHLQSPIYEWYWSTPYRKYYPKKEWTPEKFRRLYNIYTKENIPVTNIVTYPDRKYRQQARISGDKIIMPVKNIRALTLKKNTIADLTTKEMETADFIRKIPAIIDQAERYQVNFDLIGSIIDTENSNYKPTLIINRFIQEQQTNLIIQYGNASSQEYAIQANLNPSQIQNTQNFFTQDADLSAAQLINLTNIPSIEKGWISPILGKSLEKDINRIKNAHNNIKTNSLYKLVVKPILNEQQVKNQLEKTPLPMDYMLNKIYLGGVYTYELLYGNPKNIPTNTQEQYLESIIAIMWYLYTQAINKDQAFEEGTFITRDINSKIFNFLINYVKKVNPDITGTPTDKPLHVSYNPFAYCRASTHFQQYQDTYKHYGIDIRKGIQGSALPLLPTEKRHILFSKIEQGSATFIKMENYGIYYADGLIQHGGELIVAQTRKRLPKFITGLKSDDSPTYRKERIPNDFKNTIEKIFTNHPNSEKIVKALNKDGIQLISEKYIEKNKALFFPQNISEQKKEQLKLELQQVRTQLQKQYDYISQRYGREVILTPRELYSSLYYYLVKINDPLVNSFKSFAESIIKDKPITFNIDQLKKFYDSATYNFLLSTQQKKQ